MSHDVVLAHGYRDIFPFGKQCAKKGCGAKWGLLRVTKQGVIRSTCNNPSKPHSYSMCQQCGKLISSDNLWRHQNYGKKGCGVELSREELHDVIMERERHRRRSELEAKNARLDQEDKIHKSLECVAQAVKRMHTEMKSLTLAANKSNPEAPKQIVPQVGKPNLDIEIERRDLLLVQNASAFANGVVAIIRDSHKINLECHRGQVYWNKHPLDDEELTKTLGRIRKKLQRLLSELMVADEEKLVGSSICLLSQDLFRNLHSTSKTAGPELKAFKQAINH